MNKKEFAVMGPGKALNNSLKNKARALVSNTVLNSYFNDEWNHRRKQLDYSLWTNTGNFAGFALVRKKRTPIGRRSLEISLIGAVKGGGKELLHQIINNARAKGFRKVKLNSVTGAKPFYLKHGFKIKKENKEHCYMKYKLRPKTRFLQG
jgi:N-acetylglutamate synthase-like GNAT family acetyltransferase